MFFKIKNHVLRVYYESVMSVELKYHVAKKKNQHTQKAQSHMSVVLSKFFSASKEGSHHEVPSQMLIRMRLLEMALNYTPFHPQQKSCYKRVHLCYRSQSRTL